MDFWKTVLGLVRRKFIGPPVIATGLLVGALVFFLLPTHYQSSAFMVLTTPAAGGTQDPSKNTGLTNPLLQFNDGLRTTAAILIQSMNTPEAFASLGVVEHGPTKVLINDGSTNPDLLGTNGPFVYVEGDSTSYEEARGVVVRGQKKIRDELVTRQKELGAPESTFISVVDVVSASEPEALLMDKFQAAAVAFVLTVLLGFAGAYGWERTVVARSRRKKWPAEDADHGAATPPARPRTQFDPPTVKITPVASNGNGAPAKTKPKN
ncbi:hypothetical protein Lesp02_10860 [Lentzea sp. NBRC 105346]|uniref:hypothetical protein n=1 Tax=Lentzea sp. NBRC 105346 TaxID=3032205 RepID=UPI0024A4D1ED|nr:hypothetical protein [Lentzea sp. NBRC 105346]GLZ28896.1 hypothetical protein Lesp02_10860 [Lentzea sp. NBRC 105346]